MEYLSRPIVYNPLVILVGDASSYLLSSLKLFHGNLPPRRNLVEMPKHLRWELNLRHTLDRKQNLRVEYWLIVKGKHKSLLLVSLVQKIRYFS